VRRLSVMLTVAIILMVLTSGVAVAAKPLVVPGKPTFITILHTNDSHGKLESFKAIDNIVGGSARIATLVRRFGRVLLASFSSLTLEMPPMVPPSPTSLMGYRSLML